MRITGEPVLIDNEGPDTVLSVDGGSSVNYGRSRAAQNLGTVAVGQSVAVSDPVWIASTGAFSEVHVLTAPPSPPTPTTGTILLPSGDSTGAADTAAINAALATAGASVILHGDFTTNAPIEISSDSSLTLWDAKVQLAPAASCNILRNKNWNQTTQTDKRIRVIGVGRAQLVAIVGTTLNQASTPAPQTTLILNDILAPGQYEVDGADLSRHEIVTIVDGNSTQASSPPYTATLAVGTTQVHSPGVSINNQVRGGASTNLYRWTGALFSSVDDLTISGITVGPCNMSAVLLVGVTNADVDLEVAQDGTQINQDGLDIGPGTSDIHVRRLVGRSNDDFVSIFGKKGTSIIPVPWQTAGGSISNLQFDVVDAYAGLKNVFRIQAGDGFTTSGIRVGSVVQRNLSILTTLFCMGEKQYVTSGVYPTSDQLTDIRCGSVQGCSRLIELSMDCSNIEVNRAIITGPFDKLIGDSNATANNNCSAKNLTIRNVTAQNPSSSVLATDFGYLLKLGNFQPADTIDGLVIENIDLNKATGLLANDATVTNLKIKGVHVGALLGVAFTSTVAETGSIADIAIDSGPAKTYLGAAMKLKQGGRMPAFRSYDVTPDAATRYSQIVCSTKDPTGGVFANAATYTANNGAWQRTVDLGTPETDPFPGFVQDTMTGTDATLLQSHTVEIGGPCTKHTSSVNDGAIQTNRARGNASTVIYYYPANPPSADYTVKGVLQPITDNNSAAAGPAGRIDTAANTMLVGRYNTNGDQWEIQQVASGTSTILGTPFVAALVAGDIAELVLAGSNVSLKVNGTLRVGPTATTVVAAGKAGLRMAGTGGAAVGVHIDSIEAT
jgi:hypothetical protein